MKHLSLTPALLIAAQHDTSSISSLVMTYRMHGLGGDRACHKLIHRLEKLNLLKIAAGSRNDRREKSVCLTDESRQLLRELQTQLQKLPI